MLNVAITRAKRGLVLVGDEQTLSAAPVWRDYLRYLRKQGCVIDELNELIAPAGQPSGPAGDTSDG